jgi:hypothetical protein
MAGFILLTTDHSEDEELPVVRDDQLVRKLADQSRAAAALCLTFECVNDHMYVFPRRKISDGTVKLAKCPTCSGAWKPVRDTTVEDL